MARTDQQAFLNAYLGGGISANGQKIKSAGSAGSVVMSNGANISIPILYDFKDDINKVSAAYMEAAQNAVKEQQQAAKKAAQQAAKKAQQEAKKAQQKAEKEQREEEGKKEQESEPDPSIESLVSKIAKSSKSSTSNNLPENEVGSNNPQGTKKYAVSKVSVPTRGRSMPTTVRNSTHGRIQEEDQVQEEKSYSNMNTAEKMNAQKILRTTLAFGSEEEKEQAQKELNAVEKALWNDKEYLQLVKKSLENEPQNSRIERYLDPAYKLNKVEQQDAKDIAGALLDQSNSMGRTAIGTDPDTRQQAQELFDTAQRLYSKTSNAQAILAGALDAIPLFRETLDTLSGKINEQLYPGEDRPTTGDSFQNLQTQSPIAYTTGTIGGNLALYSAASAAARGIPALQSFGQTVASTPAAQAVQGLPVIGRLGTADAIAGMTGDALVDLSLDTLPRLGSNLIEYNQQQNLIQQGLAGGKTMDDMLPTLQEYYGEYLTPGSIAADTLQNVGANFALGLGGEIIPELFRAGSNALRRGANAAQNGVDDAARAAYNGINNIDNGGVTNASEAVDDAARAVAGNSANGAGSGGNGWQSQFGAADGAGLDLRSGETGPFAAGYDIPPERVSNPDLESAYDLTSAERAAEVNAGKDLRSSTTRKIKSLYDDYDGGKISDEDFSARAQEIARSMVSEDDFSYNDMSDTLREIRRVAKGQKLYVGDIELNDLLSASGAKSLSDFNKRFGTQLTRDRQYIALDQIDSDLYWQYAGGRDTSPADTFWSVVDGIKGNGAKQFDKAGYDEAVDYYRDLIERFDRYSKEPGSAIDAQAQYVPGESIPSLYQPYGANADLSINDLPESMLNDTLPSLYDDLPESIGAMRHNPRSYAGMQAEYGTIAPGENAARVVDVPISTNGTDRVSASARTFMEAPQTSDELVELFEKGVEDGIFSHNVKRDADSLARAVSSVEQEGYQNILTSWKNLMRTGATLNKEQIVQGQLLYTLAAKNGDTATAMELAGDLARIATEAGQNLQAQRLLKRMTPEGKLYYARQTVDSFNRQLKQQLGDGFQNIEIPNELAQALMDATSTKAQNDAMQNIYQYVADQLPTDWGTRWNAWRYLAMLSNPATHVRNVLSNVVNIPARMLKNTIGAGLEGAFLRNSDKTKSILNPLSKSDRGLMSFAKKDVDNVMQQLTGAQKYSDRSAILQMVDPFKVNGTWGKNANSNVLAKGTRKIADLVSSGLSKLYKFNSWALGAEDMLFKKSAYADSLAQYLKANGIDPVKATEKQLDAAREYAVEEALRATYTEFNGLAQAIGNIEKRNIGAKIFVGGTVPFKSTPLNIIRRGVRYSPVGLAESITAGAFRLRAGEINANQFIDNISQGLSGSAIFSLGIWLGYNGIVNGISPENKKEQSLKSSQGWQNYSINLPGGGTYTIDWGGPSVMAILAGVETAKAFQQDGMSFNDLASALGNITEPMFDTTMLSGINSAIQSATYAGSNPATALASQAVSNFVTQGVPSLSGVFARAYDETRRTTYSDKEGVEASLDEGLQRIKNKVPGQSEDNEPYIDVWGREQENPGGSFVGRLAYGLLSPGYYSPDRSTAADSVVEELYQETGDSRTLPSLFSSSVTVDGEKMKLSPENYTRAKETKGQASRQMIESLYDYPQYNMMGADVQAEVVSSIYTLANNVAKYEVIPSLYDSLVSEIESGDASKSEVYAAMFLTGGAEQVIPYLVADELTSGVSADKNENGNSIPGTKEKNFVATLMQYGYSRDDAEAIYQVLK